MYTTMKVTLEQHVQAKSPFYRAVVKDGEILHDLAEGTQAEVINWVEENYPLLEGSCSTCKGFCPACLRQDQS